MNSDTKIDHSMYRQLISSVCGGLYPLDKTVVGVVGFFYYIETFKKKLKLCQTFGPMHMEILVGHGGRPDMIQHMCISHSDSGV